MAMAARPFESTFGSSISTPWSRMHSAKARNASSGSSEASTPVPLAPSAGASVPVEPKLATLPSFWLLTHTLSLRQRRARRVSISASSWRRWWAHRR